MASTTTAGRSAAVNGNGTARVEKTEVATPKPLKPKLVKPSMDPDYACFRMELRRSRIHRWGVFATEFIPANRKVVEYTGERINRVETKRRANTREFTYLFTLDPYWTIDGAVGGSGAEYINHSCEPNLISRILKGHILYFTLRDIQAGEELTIDYRFDKKVERVSCLCGAPGCRGTINLNE